MKSTFYKAKTYSCDFELFKQLGFKQFETDEFYKEIIVGDYNFKDTDTTVNVKVTCVPAQFWEFEIIKKSGEKMVITTGSGALINYWKIVELIATNMVSIKL